MAVASSDDWVPAVDSGFGDTCLGDLDTIPDELRGDVASLWWEAGSATPRIANDSGANAPSCIGDGTGDDIMRDGPSFTACRNDLGRAAGAAANGDDDDTQPPMTRGSR